VFATTRPPAQRLLVFARVPELGRVKTRLGETIGAERALAVYQAMLRDLLRSIGPSDADIEIEIMWAPTAGANAESLRKAFGPRSLAMQTGETLGDRLAMALSERFFFHRTQKIVAIGVDDPRLTRGLVSDAFALLDSCEWVVGPANDGGFYLIGCRGAIFNPAIFRDVPWGTSKVLKLTLERISATQNTVAMLPARYDIDVIEDLQRFARENINAEGDLPRLLREWGIAA
jgi:rSAM/selenodomain-associated transferase 1